ncbi:MAG: hypothetical protein WBO55_05400 [Rhizobiaceae bacterium]
MPLSSTAAPVSRRTFLATTATLAAGAAVPAFAMASPRDNPCIGFHAEAGEMLAAIERDPGIGQEIKARMASMTQCPHCATRLSPTRRFV